MTLHIDFESRSRVNLITDGAYKYAQDPSTQVICMGWAVDDDDVQMWVPGEPFPETVRGYFMRGEPRSIHAHNAQFERLISWYVLWPQHSVPEPPIDAFYCTAAQARSRALPGNLEDLGRCLNLRTQKDKRGKELIKLLCIPQADGTFNTDPNLLKEMYEYCRTDVVVERLAEGMSPPLNDDEFAEYVVSEMVNDTGLRVDVEFAKAATNYAEDEIAEINAEIDRVTTGEITSARQYQRIKLYLKPYMDASDAVRKAMTVVKTDRRSGEETRKISFGKDIRRKLAEMAAIDPDLFPPDVLELIDLVDEAGRSSVAKYRNMVARASDDGRVRGAYMFAGAGQTGRYSSLGLQVHNMPRKCADDPDAVRELVMADRALDGVMDTLSSMLRPSIIPAEGHTFVCGDWSAIEARVLPWLSGSNGGSQVLDVFAECDRDPNAPDIYMLEAAGIYNVEATAVTKDQRQVGKVAVLALGYQGGYRAFQAMARGYGVTMADDDAERIKLKWRYNNAWAVAFWRDLERAAIDAVRHPGTTHKVGKVGYFHPGEGAPLYCELPSGRIISYPFARVEAVEYRDSVSWELSAVKAQWKPMVGELEWPRIGLYGGLLAENITQATAACLLRACIRRVYDLNWPLVLHCHDEVAVEIFDDEVEEAKTMLAAEMLRSPAWADGLPMAVELWAGKRYRK